MTEGMIGISEARNVFSELLNRVAFGRERVVVQSRGKPKAAIIPMQDFELLKSLEDTALGLLASRRLADGQVPIPVEEVITRYEREHGVSLGLRGSWQVVGYDTRHILGGQERCQIRWL